MSQVGRPQASIVILTYQSERYVQACLSSVLATKSPPSYEVIVVDNASRDRTLDLVRPFEDRVRVFGNGRNLLSTRGLNPGIRAARGAVVVLLDVDTEVREGWLSELIRPIQQDATVAVTGSKLLYPDGRIQHAGGMTFGNGIARHYGNGEQDKGQWDAMREVEYVTGASTAIRRSFLDLVGGGLDETFPFYYEDVDLCHQAARLGYRVLYVPSSVAVHHESVGMRLGSGRYLFNLHRGRLRHVLKNRPLRYLLRQAIPSEILWFRRYGPSRPWFPLIRASISTLPRLPRIARARLMLRRLASKGAGGPVLACVMASSLFVRANGVLSCWCDFGKDLELGNLSESDLRSPGMDVLDMPALRRIRRAFLREEEPHPGVCGKCVMYRNRVPTDRSECCRFMTLLHVEPSILCRIRCPDCHGVLDHPPKQMPLPLFDALIENLRRSGVERIGHVHFEGLGEPLMNPDLPEMVSHAKDAFPTTCTMVTTNGNFPWTERLARARIDYLRVSIDGVDQASYERYRVGGNLGKALAFLAGSARSRTENGWPRLIEWKYILFAWNDRDDQIRDAASMARELGVRCTFDMSFADDVTRRFTPDTLDAKLAEIAPDAVNISRVRMGRSHRRVDPYR